MSASPRRQAVEIAAPSAATIAYAYHAPNANDHAERFVRSIKQPVASADLMGSPLDAIASAE